MSVDVGMTIRQSMLPNPDAKLSGGSNDVIPLKYYVTYSQICIRITLAIISTVYN